MRRASVLLILALAGCTSPGSGIEPPLNSVYFPTGLALSRDAEFLYIANSDFDLQYNAGTIQSLDARRIRSWVPRGCRTTDDCVDNQFCDVPSGPADASEHTYQCLPRGVSDPCQGLGEQTASDRINVPGRCKAINLEAPPDGGGSVFLDAVEIGAFATDAIVRRAPSNASRPERIFVPVRGDSTLNWVDVLANGRFDCGQGEAHACNEAHRVGRDSDSNPRGLTLPPEPYAIDATGDASAIVITHQTQGAISLLHNDWTAGPRLDFVKDGLPTMPIGVKAVPRPALASTSGYLLNPGFLVSYANMARVDLFRYIDDSQSAPAFPYLDSVDHTNVNINSGGYDVRDIVIDDFERKTCERTSEQVLESCLTQCAPTDPTCASQCGSQGHPTLVECANVPLRVYAASRSPASLLIGHTTAVSANAPNSDLPSFTDAFPLPTGPSRLQVGHIINAAGKVEPRVFIVSFDSRRIAIYDPARRDVEAWVTTGRGPQALVEDFLEPSSLDEGRALLYVGHFTDSYLGVVQLDQRRGRSYANIVLNLGEATPPRTSK